MWLESDVIPYQAASCCPAGTALVLAPHPDDEVFGCGGAIMRHLAAGDPVKVIILTDSDYGCFADGVDKRDARRKEALAAAVVLDYGKPAFWGLPDRRLSCDEALIGRLLAAITETGATILYCPSWWEIHPDHCSLALAAVEAVRRCDRPLTLAMYEVGVPLHPNLLLDITDLAERKRAAMACFTSQLAMQAYDTQIMALHQYRTYTLPARVRFAEAYRLMDQEELRWEAPQALGPAFYLSQTLEKAMARAWQSGAGTIEVRCENLASASNAAPANQETSSLKISRAPQLVEESRAECQRLRLEIDSLRASRSDRLTRPFRMIITWFRQVCGIWRGF